MSKKKDTSHNSQPNDSGRIKDTAGPTVESPIEVEDLLSVSPEEVEIRKSNPLRPSGILGDLFDFLASLRLAVILLTVMGVVCIAGTIYESSYTARLAQRLVYRTPWFDFLIISIFVNVLFATLARFPWRLSQTGFLVTHLGVLLTLVGTLITHMYGVEGQMMLNEGQAKNSIQTSNSFIAVQKAGENVRDRFDAVEVEWGHPSQEKPQVYNFDRLGLRATVTGFLPDSEWQEVWTDDGKEENPAIHFSIDNSSMGRMTEGWLAPLEPSNKTMNLGPATISAKLLDTAEDLQRELAPPTVPATAEMGVLEIKLKGADKPVLVDIASARKGPLPVSGSEYAIHVTDQMDSGYINDAGQLANDPQKPANPVVIYDLYKGDTRLMTRQIEYANFPDFDMMHSKEMESPFEATYKYQAGAGSGSEFLILLGPQDKITWKVSSSGQISSGSMTLGTPVPMPMMTAGMTLSVDKYLKKAARSDELVERPIKKGDFGSRAARIEFSNNAGAKQSLWVEMFEEKTIQLGDSHYIVTYQNEEYPIGFSIQLKDFRLMHYPGGEMRPMSYESDVKVISDGGKESLIRDNITIRMNEPLDHGGYRVFQSSYIDQPRGDPRISIFSIAYDPGVNVIYLGSIVLCLGIAIMFYAKGYLLKLEQARQQA